MLLTFYISSDGGHFVACSCNKMQKLRRRREGDLGRKRGEGKCTDLKVG